MSELRQILIDARALIARRNGWIQHAYIGLHGGYCAVGAVSVAGDGKRTDDAEMLLNECVPKRYEMRSILCFNDEPTTTKRAVLAVFDRAIKKASP